MDTTVWANHHTQREPDSGGGGRVAKGTSLMPLLPLWISQLPITSIVHRIFIYAFFFLLLLFMAAYESIKKTHTQGLSRPAADQILSYAMFLFSNKTRRMPNFLIPHPFGNASVQTGGRKRFSYTFQSRRSFFIFSSKKKGKSHCDKWCTQHLTFDRNRNCAVKKKSY